MGPFALEAGASVVVEDSVRGVTWSAWAYRNGAEYDIAVSWLDSSGRWSEPELLGFDDDVDQRDPALLVDRNGVVYLAYQVFGSQKP